MARRRQQIQGGGEVLGKKSPAATATATATQSGSAGSVPVDSGEADNEAACGGDAKLENDMVGDDVELVGNDAELVGNDVDLVGDDV
jgi:hypothetical protein